MKIITLSAKARHGKDYTASCLKKELENEGYKVLVCHFADLLKYICKSFFNWNGKKDIEGRTILQYVGTDIIRKKEPDYWVNFLISVFKLFPDEWDYVIIPDSRFPNENNKLKENFEVITIRIERPNFDNGLTEKQQKHSSEVSLDDYIFDIKIINDGTPYGLHKEINKAISLLK